MVMALPPQSYIAWQASITTLHAFAVISTTIRLYDRFRRRIPWWDDVLALFVILADVVYVAIMWLAIKPPSEMSIEVLSSPLYSYWLTLFLYFTVIWVSRISLSLSIARVLPTNQLPRNLAYSLAFLFLLMYIAAVISTKILWNFNFTSNTKESSISFAGVGTDIVMSLDLVADAILVLFPLLLFWRVKLESGQRRLILPLFSASILTLLSVAVFATFSHASFELGPDALLIITMLSYIEAGISVLVCNLLIVVFYFYRYIRKRSEDEETFFGSGSDGRVASDLETKTEDVDLDLTRPSQIVSHPWTRSGVSTVSSYTNSTFSINSSRSLEEERQLRSNNISQQSR